jgi:energy-coupling factor transport system substrate-specific component
VASETAAAAGGGGFVLPREQPRPWLSGALSALPLVAVSIIGVAAFLYPFLLSDVAQAGEDSARAGDAPLIFALVLSLALLLVVTELTRQRMSAKTVSLLAVVIVAAAALRIPTLPAGATAFFFFVIVSGYVFGARLGFLAGAGALFVSAFAVGGFGPWLPFQVFASGWVGMTAGWLGSALGPALRGRRRAELTVLALFAGAWGFLFGALMNLWFWPFIAAGESISWRPGMGWDETLRHYWSFYLVTSAGWDGWRALGNVVLVLIAGRPTLDLLARFRDRFAIRFE